MGLNAKKRVSSNEGDKMCPPFTLTGGSKYQVRASGGDLVYLSMKS